MPPDALSDDATLLGAIAAGREAALGLLVARHGPGLAALATRYLGNPAEAEDVVQETFLRVWQNAARFDPVRAKPSTWIYSIAVRLCIDRLRRLKLRRFLSFGGTSAVDPDAVDLLADPAPGPEAALAGRQELHRTRIALAALPDRQRLAILLAAVGGLDTQGIAETLDISPGAVEQLLIRARRTLRSMDLRA